MIPVDGTWTGWVGNSAIMADATKTTAHPVSHMTYTQAPEACEKTF